MTPVSSSTATQRWSAGDRNGAFVTPHWRRWRIALLCAAGVLLNIWLACYIFLPGAWQGRNDFLGFYAGAKLAGSPKFYDPASISQVLLQAIGETGEIHFERFPYYGWMLKPLALLPYQTAYMVWETLSALALIGFLALWPGAGRRTRWCVACWSLPMFVCFFNGQEDLLLLFWVALAAWLLRSGKPALAGMALALCASKFHLFTLVPLVLVAQRRWRMAAGAALGLAALLAISFAVAGRTWPVEYYTVLTHPDLNISLAHMPNLHSLFGAGPLGIALQIVTAAALAVGVFLAARSTTSFEQPLALAMAAGILVGFHGYLHDGSLLLPGILAFFAAPLERVRMLAFALASPVPWFLLQSARPAPAVTQLLILAFACTGMLMLMQERFPQPGIRARAAAPAGTAEPAI